MISPTMGLEIAGDRHTTDSNAAMVAETQKLMAVVDSICASMRFALNLAKQMTLYTVVTGIPFDE